MARPYMGATRHTMLGAGGKIVEPLSEHVEIDRAIRAIEGEEFDKAVSILSRLYNQVRQGYHRNPRRERFDAGRVVGQIAEDVHDIRYTHARNGEDFEHIFNGEVEVFAVLRNGKRELLISHREGLPLWDEFPD